MSVSDSSSLASRRVTVKATQRPSGLTSGSETSLIAKMSSGRRARACAEAEPAARRTARAASDAAATAREGRGMPTYPWRPEECQTASGILCGPAPGGGMRPGPLVLAVSLVALPAPAVDPPRATEYEDLAADLLRQYIQVDTTNPPGNELKAARFYKEVLDREGIPAEIDEFAPGRANLLATLKGRGTRRPLILANHMDVVPADASRWTAPPFSGLVKDGLVYGRGAQDMKSEGILQLVTLIRARRERTALDRDVLFLATADEEVDFAGALRALGPGGWRDRLQKAEYSITEGGENVLGEDGRPLYFGIDPAEKGPFWLKLGTTGTPGHGSRPMADSAPNRLLRALERVRLHRTEMKVLP